jgi:bifunctional DNA-binding transcriptional regulator/antitoxin component of YhaV-PrlF toxin-antitoxin module
VTVTTKGQITVPSPLCRRFDVQKGTTLDIFPLDRDSFVAHVRHTSRILDFVGDLATWRRPRHTEATRR